MPKTTFINDSHEQTWGWSRYSWKACSRLGFLIAREWERAKCVRPSLVFVHSLAFSAPVTLLSFVIYFYTYDLQRAWTPEQSIITPSSSKLHNIDEDFAVISTKSDLTNLIIFPASSMFISIFVRLNHKISLEFVPPPISSAEKCSQLGFLIEGALALSVVSPNHSISHPLTVSRLSLTSLPALSSVNMTSGRLEKARECTDWRESVVLFNRFEHVIVPYL